MKQDNNRKIISSVVILSILLLTLFTRQFTASANQITDRPEATKNASSTPKYLYILVDESKTANLADDHGEIRSEIVSSVVQFASGYSWLDNSILELKVYQYNSYFNYTNQIFPNEENTDNKITDKNLFYTTTLLTSTLEQQRNTISEYEDNFDIVLSEIYQEIITHHKEDPQNTMVIIITEGRQLYDKQTTVDFLGKAIEVWKKLPIPTGVVLFAGEENLEDIKKTWCEFFVNKLNFMSSEDILDINTSLEPPIRETQVWEWIANFYNRNIHNPKIQFQNLEINSSNNKIAMNLDCYSDPTRIFAYQSSNDLFKVNSNISQGLKQLPLGKLDVAFWEITDIPINEFDFSVEKFNDQKVGFFYARYCLSNTPTQVLTTNRTATNFLVATTDPKEQNNLNSGILSGYFSENQKRAYSFFSALFLAVGFLIILVLICIELQKLINKDGRKIFSLVMFSLLSISTIILIAIRIGKMQDVFIGFFTSAIINYGSLGLGIVITTIQGLTVFPAIFLGKRLPNSWLILHLVFSLFLAAICFLIFTVGLNSLLFGS